MPEINLPELFSTLGIGIFSAIYILYLRHLTQVLFRNRNIEKKVSITSEVIRFLTRIKKIDFSVSGLTVIAFTLLFGFGTLIHEVVHKWTVSNADQSKATLLFKDIAGLKLKRHIIKDLLVNEKDSLTAFGTKIFSNDSIINTVNNTLNTTYFELSEGEKVNIYWGKHYHAFLYGTEKKKFIAFIDEIAFLSKNWCYLCTENVADELRKIDYNINFSRCIATVSAIFLLLVILIYTLFYLYKLYKLLFHRVKFKHVSYSKMPVIILIVLQLIGRTAYPISQDGFNKRILGYYLNHFSYHDEYR